MTNTPLSFLKSKHESKGVFWLQRNRQIMGFFFSKFFHFAVAFIILSDILYIYIRMSNYALTAEHHIMSVM